VLLLFRFLFHTFIRMKMAVFWAIVLMMEAVSTSETSVSFYQTIRRNNPEDSHLHTRRRESLRSHFF
jgi:hypothetical protein